MYSVGMAMSPEMGDGRRTAPREDRRDDEAVRAAEGGYFNFTEAPCDVDAILPPDVCDRLREVKRAYDPENRIVANHAVSLEVRRTTVRRLAGRAGIRACNFRGG